MGKETELKDKLDLGQLKEVVIRPAEVTLLTEVTIQRIVDRFKEKQVIAFIDEVPEAIILWQKETYPVEWKKSDAIARLKEVINNW